MITSSSKHFFLDYSLDELWELAKSKLFMAYLIILCCCILLMLSVIQSTSMHRRRQALHHWRWHKLHREVAKIKEREHQLEIRLEKLEAAIAGGGKKGRGKSGGAGGESNASDPEAAADDQPNLNNSWTDAFIFAVCAGMIGALSMLLAGCASKTIIMAFKVW